MISVVVPVKNEWALTERLLDCLAIQPCRVLVIDNGSTDLTARNVRKLQRGEEWRGRLHRTDRPGFSIYQMWNHGFDWAHHQRASAAWHVLMTNNDIELPHGALSALLAPLLNNPDVWVTYPDYDAPWDAWRGHTAWRKTRGVLSDGGMFGACFMLAGHRIPWRPLITDLSYLWWYADNHLAECIEQEGGQQIRVEGLPVQHVNEGTARHEPPDELYLKKLHDRGLWITREQRGQRAVDRRYERKT